MLHFLLLFIADTHGYSSIGGLKYYEPVLYDTTETELGYRRLLGDRQTYLNLNLYMFNRTYKVEVKLITYHLEMSMNNSKFTERSPLLQGRVIGESVSFVTGHVDGGHFRGKVTTGSHKFEIFPAHYFKELNSDSNIHTIGFRLSSENGSDLKNLSILRCGHGDLVNVGTNHSHKSKSKRSVVSGPMMCDIKVYVDYEFYQRVMALRGTEAQAVIFILNEVKLLLSETSHIYQTTEFTDGSNVYDNVMIVPIMILIDTKNNWGISSIGSVDVSQHLNSFTSEFASDNKDECARLLITGISHQDVIGLANVGQDGTDSGICGRLNTMFISVHSNSNTFISLQESTVLLAHEIGHLLSSEHDPPGTDCLPGESSKNGNYIMTAYASSVKKYNTDKFSQCSIKQMGSFISYKRSCFKDKYVPICGDGILDKGEHCEPQSGNDPCCDKNCKFKDTTYTCSALHGPCCFNCKMATAADNHECKKETQCSTTSMCDGASYECPSSKGRNENKVCNITSERENRFFLCNNGACNGSICGLDSGWTQCLPHTDDAIQNCLMGCENRAHPTSCVLSNDMGKLPPKVVSFLIDKNLKSLTTPIYSQCFKNMKQTASDRSFCDAKHICRDKIADTSIDSIIRKILNSNLFTTIYNNLKKNVWIIAVVVVAFIILSFVLVLVCAPPIKGDNVHVCRRFTIHTSKYNKSIREPSPIPLN